MNTIDVAFMPLQNITNPLNSNKALVEKIRIFASGQVTSAQISSMLLSGTEVGKYARNGNKGRIPPALPA